MSHTRIVQVTKWLVSVVIWIGLLVAWWLLLAPATFGGSATYALVLGRSMEPALSTGDLVIARHADSYRAGDLVVFGVKEDFLVVHRLVRRTDGGWTTKGDNRPNQDGWVVPSDAILGIATWVLPGFAVPLAWWSDHPHAAGFLVATVSTLAFVPRRRRRVSSLLRATLTLGATEAVNSRTLASDCALLLLTVSWSLAGIWSSSRGASEGALTLRGIPVPILLAIACTWLWIVTRFDGQGTREPRRSLVVLSRRLHGVPALPATHAHPVPSALALRTLAERYRLPVLHRVDPVTGVHEFLLLTVQRGAFLWTVGPGPRHRRDRLLPFAVLK